MYSLPHKWTLGFLIVLTLFTFSCRKEVASTPPPPPPPPTQPAPPTPPPAITLKADRTAIDRGQAVTLEWETRNAAAVSIEPGLGTVDVNGKRQVSPTSSVTYIATAKGPGGNATDTARITVNVPPAPPATTTSGDKGRPPVTAEALWAQNMEDILFDYDKADIRPQEMSKLQKAAAYLKQNPNTRFTIEGHCDERGSEEYNLGLGDRRANTVKEYLISQGVQASRINSVSYGEERQICRDQTETCFEQNRRAHFAMNP